MYLKHRHNQQQISRLAMQAHSTPTQNNTQREQGRAVYGYNDTHLQHTGFEHTDAQPAMSERELRMAMHERATQQTHEGGDGRFMELQAVSNQDVDAMFPEPGARPSRATLQDNPLRSPPQQHNRDEHGRVRKASFGSGDPRISGTQPTTTETYDRNDAPIRAMVDPRTQEALRKAPSDVAVRQIFNSSTMSNDIDSLFSSSVTGRFG